MDAKIEIEHRLTTVEDRSKSNQYRIDEMEKRQADIEELVGTVKVLATRQETVESDVKEIKSDVKELTNKPGKRWDSIIEKAIGVIVAALIGFLLARIGL